jgi:hypothetical protein
MDNSALPKRGFKDMPAAEPVILIARRQAGLELLLHALESHPDIDWLREVFDLASGDADEPRQRGANYFKFLHHYAAENVDLLLPDQHERVFLDFVEYLRCFSAKRWLLIHVTPETTHLLTAPTARRHGVPCLFDLIREHGVKVVQVTQGGDADRWIATEFGAYPDFLACDSGEFPAKLEAWLNVPANFPAPVQGVQPKTKHRRHPKHRR